MHTHTDMAALISGRELSREFGIPERTLDQWRYLGRGPRFIRVGRHIRYRRTDIEAWLADNTVDPRPAA
jgi:hypothetical protein